MHVLYVVSVHFQIILVLIYLLNINADVYDNFEVLTINDSQKLWDILDKKRVVMEYNGAWSYQK
jgi:hypothetical protein